MVTSQEQLTAQELAVLARRIRECILQQSKRANVGHIGSALSIADILAALYSNVLRATADDDPDRDRVVLSKGHAALALYSTLFLRGKITEETLNSYCCDNSLLGAHPEHALTGIDFSTGSLGMGLSFGAGAALAARAQKSKRRVFVVISDAELNEGSLWEAAMFAAHHKLSQLIAILDLNKQQAFGYTQDVLDLAPVAERFKAFGWSVYSIDGHNHKQIVDTINKLNNVSGRPHILVAHTTFGKGVSFMENQIKWHYSPMSDDEFKQAMSEVGKT